MAGQAQPPAVDVSRDGPVYIVTLHRPHARNAVDGPTATALAAAFRAFFDDDTAKVAVLFGAGGHFCAGADLAAFAAQEGQQNRTAPDGDGPMGITRMVSPKPTIAAIAGYCVAGGLELALWCDLRVVERSAKLGVFCRRVGVPLIDGGTFRLPRVIGQGRALDLILTGREVEATEALNIGLATRVADDGEAKAEAVALAKAIAKHPQPALKADRNAAYEAFSPEVERALAKEFATGAATLADAKRGATAFADGAGRHGKAMPERDSSS